MVGFGGRVGEGGSVTHSVHLFWCRRQANVTDGHLSGSHVSHPENGPNGNKWLDDKKKQRIRSNWGVGDSIGGGGTCPVNTSGKHTHADSMLFNLY